MMESIQYLLVVVPGFHVRMRIGIDPIIDLFADEIDSKGDEGDAKARGCVTELIRQHWMLPPLIPSPEELSCVFSRSHFQFDSFSLSSLLPSLYMHLLYDTNKTKQTRNNNTLQATIIPCEKEKLNSEEQPMASSDSVPSFTVVGYAHTTSTSPPNNHLSSLSHVTLLTVTVLAVAVTVSLAVYFLLRHRNRFLRRISPSSAAVFSSGNRISPENASASVVDSLPAFTFSSVTRRATAGGGSGDCAVCLSKFEQHDLLRLLPLCCHAFHAECIDTWLRSNLTCPLCRSAVGASESDLAKVFRSSSVGSGDSFRLEIGNLSSRRGGATFAAGGETRGRSYSVGEFEYCIDEEAEVEVAFSNAHLRSVSGEKGDGAPVEAPADYRPNLAGEIGLGGSSNGNGWLKDYVDRLSNTMSFRSSGRFFTGSTRQSDVVLDGDYDVEANRLGDEISEMFRWFSGV